MRQYYGICTRVGHCAGTHRLMALAGLPLAVAGLLALGLPCLLEEPATVPAPAPVALALAGLLDPLLGVLLVALRWPLLVGREEVPPFLALPARLRMPSPCNLSLLSLLCEAPLLLISLPRLSRFGLFGSVVSVLTDPCRLTSSSNTVPAARQARSWAMRVLFCSSGEINSLRKRLHT